MSKEILRSIREKNLIISRIIDSILTREHFLMLGHHNADDDCISSMVAFSLLLRRFDKDATIFFGNSVHEHFQYLLNMCRYNSIRIVGAGDAIAMADTVVVCDVPKPSMVGIPPDMIHLLSDPGVRRIEIDHHIGADSDYIGDPGYRLVTEASSASELVGHVLLKLSGRKEILERYQIADLYSRNLVLAILTGIVGDSRMGQFLKSRRERRYYEAFSTMFNDLLSRKTIKKTNFFNMNQVFSELQKLSGEEDNCFSYMMERKRVSPSVAYVALSEDDMARLRSGVDGDIIVAVTRSVTDALAEESKKLGMVVYYDDPAKSDLIQFRIRRAADYKKYDVRNLLSLFSIQNGGGHEGAIGFRIPRGEIPDLQAYVKRLLDGIEEVVPS